MSSHLEYANLNQRINYPFKDNVEQHPTRPIATDWFIDILIYDKKANLGDCYLSNFNTSVVAQNAVLVFKEVGSNAVIVSTTIPFGNLVNHGTSTTESFYSFENARVGVKILFGEGILSQKITASRTYTAAQATILPTNVIILPPMVEELNFLNYDGSTEKQLTEGSLNAKVGFNWGFFDSTRLGMDVLSGSGLGLFDGCNTSPVVQRINKVESDPNGNIGFLNSDCYTLRPITSEDLILSALDLARYQTYEIPSQDPEVVDLLQIDGTFVLENNCQPKCPAQNLNAFAEYLNRVYDGVQDMTKYLTLPNQTCGVGVVSTTSGYFNATSFSSTQIGQTGFIKYFHEGKQLVLVVPNAASIRVEIIEVIDSTHLRIANVPLIAGNYNFCVDDRGVVVELNEAITEYNDDQIASATNPKSDITHYISNLTKFNGVSGNVVSVVALIYNPTAGPITVNLAFTTTGPTFVLDGALKVTKGDTILENVSSFSLASRQTARAENIFFRPCGNSVASSVAMTVTSSPTPMTNGSKTFAMVSAQCPGLNGLQQATGKSGSPFCYKIPETGHVMFNESTLPPWAITHNIVNPATPCNISGVPTVSQSTSYYVEGIVTNAGGSYPFRLTITIYVLPVITTLNLSSPRNQYFALQVVASNSPTSYAATGLPAGAVLNSMTGLISGTVVAPANYVMNVSATNPAGTTFKAITLHIT